MVVNKKRLEGGGVLKNKTTKLRRILKFVNFQIVRDILKIHQILFCKISLFMTLFQGRVNVHAWCAKNFKINILRWIFSTWKIVSAIILLDYSLNLLILNVHT